MEKIMNSGLRKIFSLVMKLKKSNFLFDNRIKRRVLLDKILQEGLLDCRTLKASEIERFEKLLSPFLCENLNTRKLAQLINTLQTEGSDSLEVFKMLLLSSDLTFEEFFLLNEVFLFLGKFSKSLAIRELSAERLVDSKNDLPIQRRVDTLFKAYIDRKSFIEARNLVKGDDNYNDNLINDLRFKYLNLFHPEDQDNDKKKTSQDDEFSNYIKGKRVAIVGPCRSTENSGSEIDDFDIVVRFNFRGKGQSMDLSSQGSKTDISYYNGVYSKSFNQNNALIDVNLSYAVFKEKRDLVNLAPRVNGRCRIMPAYNKVLSFTNFNAIPNSVLDLLFAQSGEIKIFNSDLLLDKDYHSFQSYRPAELGKVNIRFGFFGHNPLDQYRILHSLWNLKLITGDSRFSEVMSYGELEYLRQFEEIYSPSYDRKYS